MSFFDIKIVHDRLFLRESDILIGKKNRGDTCMSQTLQNECTPSCIICGQEKTHGIMIISEFICEECETEMVRTEVGDVKYPFFIHQMKQILYKKNA